MSWIAWSLSVALFACACASDPKPPVSSKTPRSSVAGDRAQPAPAPRERLTRAEVEQAVSLGLGHFLQYVEVEPSFEQRVFVGFRIVDLVPADAWQGVDLRRGDIVLKVNGQPIETETQAHQAFTALRTASELRVTYLRDGERRELVLPIDGQPTLRADAGA